MAFSRSTVVTLSSPFGPSSDKLGPKRIMHFVGLLWPLLTSRSAGRPNSAMPASPFQASGETSRVRTMTFPAQSPDLRRFPLVAGASRSVVRSPRSAAPRIRFLFVDSRVRFTLRSAYASRRTPCASLRSLRPGSGRTFTSKSSPMPGPPQLAELDASNRLLQLTQRIAPANQRPPAMFNLLPV